MEGRDEIVLYVEDMIESASMLVDVLRKPQEAADVTLGGSSMHETIRDAVKVEVKADFGARKRLN